MENPQCNVVPRRYAVHELYNVHVPSMHVLSLYKLYGKFEMTSTFDLYLLSGAKTMPISGVIREKNQRLEVVRGVRVIDQSVCHIPDDSNPASDKLYRTFA